MKLQTKKYMEEKKTEQGKKKLNLLSIFQNKICGVKNS